MNILTVVLTNQERIPHESVKPIFWQYKGNYLVIEYGKHKHKYDKSLVEGVIDG